MRAFYYLDSVTSAGKTRGAGDFVAAYPSESFCFVMRSVELIDRTIDEFRARHPEAEGRIRWFHSGMGGSSVTGQIAQYLKTMPEGAILFITHAAWQMMAHFHRTDRWRLIVDEMIQSTYNETFTLCFDESRKHLIDLLTVTREDQTYSRIDANDLGAIRDRAHNKHRDQIAEIFKALSAKLVASSHWSILVVTKQWEAFITGKINQIEFHGRFHPCAFDGYIDVTFMAANLKETLTYRHFLSMGCSFIPHKQIRVRYTDHTNGSRLKIMYFTNRPWSKNLHKMQIMVDGKQMTILQCYRRTILKEFEGQEYLWLANAGKEYDNALDGVRLPNVPQGFNHFQGYHRCAILAALNPTPSHGVFLQEIAQMTAREIRRALLSECSYQAMGRGSIRNPDATEEYVLIVPDRITANDIAKLYPGSTISLLLGYDPVPPLKVNRYDSDEDRHQARLFTYREANEKRNRHRYISTCCTPDQATQAGGPSPLFVAETPDQVRSSIVHTLNDWAEIAPQRNNIGGFAYSEWANIRDKDGLGDTMFKPMPDFIEELRRRQAKTHKTKKDNTLISPTIFAHAVLPDRMIELGIEMDGAVRGKENAVACRGFLLDIEHGDMTPDDFSALFPELEFVTYSSWSHTPDAPRYRIAIPSTHYVPASIHALILLTFLHRIEATGWGDKESESRKHGIDTGKLQEAAMFYWPSNRPDSFLMHMQEGRKPLNPYEWINPIPDHLLVEPRQPEPITTTQQYAHASYAPSDDSEWSVANAIDYWREHGCVTGKGRTQLWFLAKRLRQAGCEDSEMRAILWEQAGYASNPEERRSEIDGLIADTGLLAA